MLPVAVTLVGGYARWPSLRNGRVSDTVRIHVNTILAARAAMGPAARSQ
jgi:hypothetical protein